MVLRRVLPLSLVVFLVGPAVARAEGVVGGAAIEAGYQARPTDCPDYCEGAVGGGLELMIGTRVAARYALVLEVAAFTSTVTFSDEPDGLSGAISGGLEWRPDERFWLRASLGGGVSMNHNSDGGPGGGAAFLASAGFGWQFSPHVDVRARLRLYAHQSGFTPVATVGLGFSL